MCWQSGALKFPPWNFLYPTYEYCRMPELLRKACSESSFRVLLRPKFSLHFLQISGAKKLLAANVKRCPMQSAN
jgi:hypothetical protein